jgi:helicase MOV-10
VTIIEAIRQILDYKPDARILACAPSNSAADIIAERLTILGVSQLFRLNAPSRMKGHLPAALLPYSRVMGNNFSVPPVEELRKFRVVVSTCISAFVPYSIGIQAGHFSHVFVDEAGQACEPEALAGVKSLATSKTNLVLSGDPKQLGPIIRSDVAAHFKLAASLLDRLTERPLYDEATMAGVT